MSAPIPGYDLSALDPARTAREIVKEPLSLGGEVSIWQGKVVAVNIAEQTADITLGGLPTVVPGVAHNSNYRPTVNDVIWVFQLGETDFLILDRVGAFGPSLGSGAATAFVDSRQTRSSGNWGDLSTVGPSVTVPVSPSGRLLVQNSCWLWYDDIDGATSRGGAMSFALSGANTRSPEDREAMVLFATASFVQRETIAGSKVTLLSGLTPGLTTVTAKYRHVSTGEGTADFELRHLWALPL